MIDEIGASCGLTPCGQAVGGQRQLLGDDLPVDVDVGSPGELDVDHRQPDARRAAHRLHAGRAVQRRLQRKCDQRFDFFRRQARRFGHDRDARPVQVGKDVDRQVIQLVAAVDQ